MLSKKAVVLIMVVNFISAGMLIAKVFDCAMWPDYFIPAVIAVIMSGLNIFAGMHFLDYYESYCIEK